MVWAVGQLASGAPLLCGGSVLSGVTVGEVSSSDTWSTRSWSGAADCLDVLFSLGLLRGVLLELRAIVVTKGCPKAIVGLASIGSRPLSCLGSA